MKLVGNAPHGLASFQNDPEILCQKKCLNCLFLLDSAEIFLSGFNFLSLDTY